jgi:phage I-like protein
MMEEFPHKLKGSNKRPAQTVASASRTATTGRSGRKVRLTPSQVAIAKKLGVPLEEYAKYVKE